MDNLKEDTVVKFVFTKTKSWEIFKKYWLLTHLAPAPFDQTYIEPPTLFQNPIPKKNRDGNKEDFFSHLTFIWIFCLLYSALISYQVYLTSTGGKARHQIFPSWKPTWVASLYFSFFYKRVPLCGGVKPHIAARDIGLPSLSRHSTVNLISVFYWIHCYQKMWPIWRQDRKEIHKSIIIIKQK